jgi:hypothetical protein
VEQDRVTPAEFRAMHDPLVPELVHMMYCTLSAEFLTVPSMPLARLDESTMTTCWACLNPATAGAANPTPRPRTNSATFHALFCILVLLSIETSV